MTSVRKLGENISLVLTLYEGSNFFPNSDDNDNPGHLIAVASLNQEEEQESNPIQFLGPEIFFGTEFEWSMSRQSFQAIRSRKIVLRILFYAVTSTFNGHDDQADKSEKKLVGTTSIDLKEAIPLLTTTNNNQTHDVTYESHATWKHLINSKAITGRPAPSIKYALVLEPNNNLNKEESTVMEKCGNISASKMPKSGDPSLEAARSPSHGMDVLEENEEVSPKLVADKGYFLLGSEDKAKETFFLNVYITHGKNLQRAISGSNLGSNISNAKYYFSYDLFGYNIDTESFENLHDTTDDFLTEKASARIMTNSAALEHYIKNVCSKHPFQIELCTGENDKKENLIGKNVLASSRIHLSDVLDATKENLDKRTPISYEGVLSMMKNTEVSNSNNISNTSNALGRSVHSENFSLEPHIGVRFSISEKPDEGLIYRRNNDTLTLAMESEKIEGLRNERIVDSSLGLSFNDALREVNKEFERTFVPNPTNESIKIQDSNKKEPIQSPKLSVSPAFVNLSLKRSNDDPISQERSKSPRPDSVQIVEESIESLEPMDISQPRQRESSTSVERGPRESERENIAANISEDNEGASPPVITTEVLQENVRKPSTSPQTKRFTSLTKLTQDKENQEISHEKMDTNASDGMILNCKTQSTSAEKSKFQHKFRFVINLETIKLALGGPINCIIVYRSQFSSKEISTKPAFIVCPGQNTAIQNGYCEFSFSSKLPSLEKRLRKYPLQMYIHHENNSVSNSTNADDNLLLVGKSSLDLSVVFDKHKQSPERKRELCKIEVPILSTQIDSSSSSCNIGTISCTITLDTLEQVSDNLNDSSKNIKGKDLGSIASSERNIDIAAMEVENWKIKQKELFQGQLEKLEQHHINTLSEEWNKR